MAKFYKFKTYNPGLSTIFKDYQTIAMNFLWSLGGEGAGSGACWVHASKVLKEKGKTISRASVIFFLNDMLDHGVLTYVSKTGKGGHHRVYYSVFTKLEFEEHLAKVIIQKLMNEFPEGTKKAIWKLQRRKD